MPWWLKGMKVLRKNIYNALEGASRLCYHMVANGQMRRTQLLIRCSAEDAAEIRHQAAGERRSISAYVLRIIERQLLIDEKFASGLTDSFLLQEALRLGSAPIGEAAIHVRCSVEEAERVRMGAARRRMGLNSFVVFVLKRHWAMVAKIKRTG